MSEESVKNAMWDDEPFRSKLDEYETVPGDDDWYGDVCTLLDDALRKAADAGDADLPFRQWFRRGVMLLSRDPSLNKGGACMCCRYKTSAYELSGKFAVFAEGLRYWADHLVSPSSPPPRTTAYIGKIKELFGTDVGFNLKRRCFSLLFRPGSLNLGFESYSYVNTAVLHLAGADVTEDRGAPAETTQVSIVKAPVPAPTPKPTAPNPVPQEGRPEIFGRFRLYRTQSSITVEDTQNGKRYKIGRPGGNAAKAVMTLIRDYAAGNRQVHDSSREWKGAFQPGRGDATRFKEDQIFMLPKWNVEKQRYLNGQYCGK